jgi:hypothetical protein
VGPYGLGSGSKWWALMDSDPGPDGQRSGVGSSLHCVLPGLRNHTSRLRVRAQRAGRAKEASAPWMLGRRPPPLPPWISPIRVTVTRIAPIRVTVTIIRWHLATRRWGRSGSCRPSSAAAPCPGPPAGTHDPARLRPGVRPALATTPPLPAPSPGSRFRVGGGGEDDDDHGNTAPWARPDDPTPRTPQRARPGRPAGAAS